MELLQITEFDSNLKTEILSRPGSVTSVAHSALRYEAGVVSIKREFIYTYSRNEINETSRNGHSPTID